MLIDDTIPTSGRQINQGRPMKGLHCVARELVFSEANEKDDHGEEKSGGL